MVSMCTPAERRTGLRHAAQKPARKRSARAVAKGQRLAYASGTQPGFRTNTADTPVYISSQTKHEAVGGETRIHKTLCGTHLAAERRD